MSGVGEPQLVVARGHRQLADIRAFRSRTYLQRSRLVLDDEAALDRRSLVMALHRHDELVACARVVPLPDPDAGITEFVHPVLADCGADTEVGRLAVAAGHSPILLPMLLGLGSRWMLEHTVRRDYVAYCNAKLVPAYEAVGARDLGLELVRPATGRAYRFVTGRFEDAATLATGLVDALRPAPALLLTA
ncbi:MAG: hypothetical protein H0U21_11560 [Acidimicrobiia bacterium]|nr:hypothetical protein [Acidimicrobiia bacterium]